MRRTFVIAAWLALQLSAAALAQGFSDYVSREDGFTVAFPGNPTIETFTYTTEYDSKVPARRYTAIGRDARYLMTVVNMTTTDREPARQGIEIRGAIQFAATALRRTGNVTLDSYHELEGVPGQLLQITLPDGRRNYAGVYLHKRRLYILEAIMPDSRVPPLLYLASLGFVDAEGRRLTYVDTDSYTFPDGRPPPRVAEPGN
jgi:hypothetical protein